ncbi:hypothetical protein D3C80_1595130 [compost metagenome]
MRIGAILEQQAIAPGRRYLQAQVALGLPGLTLVERQGLRRLRAGGAAQGQQAGLQRQFAAVTLPGFAVPAQLQGLLVEPGLQLRGSQGEGAEQGDQQAGEQR